MLNLRKNTDTEVATLNETDRMSTCELREHLRKERKKIKNLPAIIHIIKSNLNISDENYRSALYAAAKKYSAKQMKMFLLLLIKTKSATSKYHTSKNFGKMCRM